MKVLYIAHFREGSGWSKAAIDQVEALHGAGVEVVCRDVRLTETNADPGPLVKELEKNDESDCTHCIQYVLPHHLFGSDHFERNIACFVAEIDMGYWHSWIENLKLVDEVWVTNETMKDNLVSQGIVAHKVYCPTDLSKYSTFYKETNISFIDYTYKFYTITDLNDRKNLESLIKCFHHTFDPDEDVSLILKVKKYGFNNEALTQYVRELANGIKRDMRMYTDVNHYHPEVIITGDTPDEQIMSLHQYGDCFVNLSHGEGWSIPTFDALAMGNTVIASDVPGHREYAKVDENLMYLVKTYNQICQCRDSAFAELFTGRDFWWEIDDANACNLMRLAYEARVEKRKPSYSALEPYSYQAVGNRMVELLQYKHEDKYETINS